MSLTVVVKSASKLPNVERFSKSDPMTVVTLQGMPSACSALSKKGQAPRSSTVLHTLVELYEHVCPSNYPSNYCVFHLPNIDGLGY